MSSDGHCGRTKELVIPALPSLIQLNKTKEARTNFSNMVCIRLYFKSPNYLHSRIPMKVIQLYYNYFTQLIHFQITCFKVKLYSYSVPTIPLITHSLLSTSAPAKMTSYILCIGKKELSARMLLK